MTGAPHFDFDAAIVPKPPSCTFKLGGRIWRVRNTAEITFDFMRRTYGIEEQLTRMEEAVGKAVDEGEQTISPDEANRVRTLLNDRFVQVEEFFRHSLVAEDVEPFIALLKTKGSPITMEQVGEVITYIRRGGTDETVRPTKPPSTSKAGRRPTGATSAGASSSKGTRARASAS